MLMHSYLKFELGTARLGVHYKHASFAVGAKNELSLLLVGSPREPWGAPHNAPAAVWLLLGRALLALREPDRRIPFMP